MAADLCSDACESPNDDPRPQSGRKATLNSRTTPRRSSTAPFDPRELPDLTENGLNRIWGGIRDRYGQTFENRNPIRFLRRALPQDHSDRRKPPPIPERFARPFRDNSTSAYLFTSFVPRVQAVLQLIASWGMARFTRQFDHPLHRG